jgi:hypothetical protein
LGEVVKAHELGPDVDENGNFLDELKNGMTLDEAVWKMDKDRQAQAIQYVELDRQIDDLPKFESNAIRGMIMEFLSKEMSEQGDSYRDYGIVQYFSRSSKPLGYWEACSFNTKDGKLEDYLNTKVRPAVEEMLGDLNK